MACMLLTFFSSFWRTCLVCMVYWTTPFKRFWRVFTPKPLRPEAATPRFYVELETAIGCSNLSFIFRSTFSGEIP